jgi:hypothetical protein
MAWAWCLEQVGGVPECQQPERALEDHPTVRADHLEGVESGGLRRLDDQLLAAARVVADVVHEDAWSRAGEGHHCHHREARPLVTGTAAMVHVAISTP